MLFKTKISLLRYENDHLRDAKRNLEESYKDEISHFNATMLQKDHKATALKDKVATIEAKFETLASGHANFVANSKNAIATLESTVETKIKLLLYKNAVLLRNTKRNLEEVRKDKISQFNATMSLQKDHEATVLKVEVATIKEKYKTLASDHANVKRDYEHDLTILKSKSIKRLKN